MGAATWWRRLPSPAGCCDCWGQKEQKAEQSGCGQWWRGVQHLQGQGTVAVVFPISITYHLNLRLFFHLFINQLFLLVDQILLLLNQRSILHAKTRITAQASAKFLKRCLGLLKELSRFSDVVGNRIRNRDDKETANDTTHNTTYCSRTPALWIQWTFFERAIVSKIFRRQKNQNYD